MLDTVKYFLRCRGIAQFGSVLGSGPRGRGFESRYSDHECRVFSDRNALLVSFLFCLNPGFVFTQNSHFAQSTTQKLHSSDFRKPAIAARLALFPPSFIIRAEVWSGPCPDPEKDSRGRESNADSDFDPSSHRHHSDAGIGSAHQRQEKKAETVTAGAAQQKTAGPAPFPDGRALFCRPRADWLNRTGNSRTYFLTNEGR